MKEQHAQTLVALLVALKDTGLTFPKPVKKELNNGWQILIFNGDRGMSIVCHDYSYELETAEIIGTPENWEFADSDPCTQVNGHCDFDDVTDDIVQLFSS